ncbi:MAG: hypothetical protein IAE94_05820 [Chthoniobacterales bacterium]|nr:hypothetical protein [Chthoniobacterales bacterium]
MNSPLEISRWLLIISFCAAPGLRAATLELEPTADVTFLYSSTPPVRQNLLNGGAAPIGASLHSGGIDRGSCSLLRFDVGKIPVGARVKKATLILTPVYSYAAAVYEGQERLSVYQLAAENAGWVEGTGESLREPETDPITVPGANGLYLNMESHTDDTTHEGVRWLSGGHIGLMDFTENEVASYPLSEMGLTKEQTMEISLPPSLIENWQKNRDLAKAGIVLWMNSDARQVPESKFAIFQSRESPQPPVLVLEY